MKSKVFVTRKFPDPGLETVRRTCDADVWPGDEPPPRDELLGRVRDAAGLLTMLTDPIDEQLIDAAGDGLKVISNYAVGYDNIDVAAATARSIPIGHTPGVLTETTADLAFALLLGAARRIVEGADFARAGKWKTWGPTLLLGRDVHRACLGLIGMGRIGRAVARRARGFEMDVLFHDPGTDETEIEGARSMSMDELLARSDFVSLHVPLTDRTRGFVDATALAKMKTTAALINTARGQVVDHDALYDALESGQIGYAALDVTDPEPLPKEHRLYGLANCLIIPHLGSASVQTRSKMAAMAAANLLAGLRDERLPNCVNPEVYDR
ncbi:MAG: D-glycerate dehydrogenase [Deltaproteobacteria bacterium]|nr:D-glycerate dehydrogenase [Deltaproteobacteria bacterium]